MAQLRVQCEVLITHHTENVHGVELRKREIGKIKRRLEEKIGERGRERTLK